MTLDFEQVGLQEHIMDTQLPSLIRRRREHEMLCSTSQQAFASLTAEESGSGERGDLGTEAMMRLVANMGPQLPMRQCILRILGLDLVTE